MGSFARGLGFFKQALAMASKDKDLLKPSCYAVAFGTIALIIELALIFGVYFLFENEQLRNLIIGILGVITLFSQFIISYIFSGMTSYLIYQYLSEGDGQMEKAQKVINRDFLDILKLTTASVILRLIRIILQKRSNNAITLNIVSGTVGLFEMLWSEASCLILPAMIIDDLSLKASIDRVATIISKNFLLIGISTVGIGLVTFLMSLMIITLGCVIAYVVMYSTYNPKLAIITFIIAILIVLISIVIAIVLASYIDIAYHTCLYIWARDVEKSQQNGTPTPPAPAPLAQAL